jgi:hypothetical protein
MKNLVVLSCIVVLLSACESKPKFDSLNNANVEEFVAAYAGDAGSGTPVGADLDITVKGRNGTFMHGGSPGSSLNLPEPYEYVLIMCVNLMTDSTLYEGRLINKSPVSFGLTQSEGDPAFKLTVNECEIR